LMNRFPPKFRDITYSRLNISVTTSFRYFLFDYNSSVRNKMTHCVECNLWTKYCPQMKDKELY
jgi:hypothetical protein